MTDESYPSELKYYKEHDWVRVEEDDAVFGISWFAQDALGEIVYVSLPDVGDVVDENAVVFESVKAARHSPRWRRGGRRERQAQRRARIINDDPYGDGWIVKVRMSDRAQLDAIADAYRQFLTEA
jgi:glycine cleavage system H protein